MPKLPAEDLEIFLRRQNAADLVTVLLELANHHDVVQARLARMQLADQADKLAAGFKKTLSSWKRSTRFYDYREADGYGACSMAGSTRCRASSCQSPRRSASTGTMSTASFRWPRLCKPKTARAPRP
ncbi:MAG: hypothetical protein R3E87_21815 [Burkholderiaceae bacterium]